MDSFHLYPIVQRVGAGIEGSPVEEPERLDILIVIFGVTLITLGCVLGSWFALTVGCIGIARVLISHLLCY